MSGCCADNIPLVVPLLYKLLSKTGVTAPVAYIASKLRAKETLKLWVDKAKGAGLVLEDISDEASSCEVRFHHCLALEQRADMVLHRVYREL